MNYQRSNLLVFAPGSPLRRWPALLLCAAVLAGCGGGESGTDVATADAKRSALSAADQGELILEGSAAVVADGAKAEQRTGYLAKGGFVLRSTRRASRYLSPPSCSHRLNISLARGRCDDGIAFRVEGDGCDMGPVARAA
ncbi:hypothetical protein [Aquabacterium humicola]|uniref:hypothetical protein n=1 Tax=Aquabacterium humicola TaxID=3237377 RepID=UPI002542F444|nr:hypothetical protein [Rubrivivax pictus]